MFILVVMLASLLLVGGWEFRRARRRREYPAARRRMGNIGVWLLNLLLAAFFFPSAAVVRPHLEAALGIGFPSWPTAGFGLSLVAGFLVLDLLHYLVHRCEHAVPLLWRCHALHHSDPDVDATTALRHHPFEYLSASAVYALAVLVLDLPAVVALAHGLVAFAAAAFQHGNIRLPQGLERRLQPVLMTTDLHRTHHSVSRDQADSNYGDVLAVWDRLFGTYVRITRAEHENIVFGVRELPRRDCLKPSAMLLTPWLIGRARNAEAGG